MVKTQKPKKVLREWTEQWRPLIIMSFSNQCCLIKKDYPSWYENIDNRKPHLFGWRSQQIVVSFPQKYKAEDGIQLSAYGHYEKTFQKSMSQSMICSLNTQVSVAMMSPAGQMHRQVTTKFVSICGRKLVADQKMWQKASVNSDKDGISDWGAPRLFRKNNISTTHTLTVRQKKTTLSHSVIVSSKNEQHSFPNLT